MEEKILDFIMEYAHDKLKDIISDAIWDRDNVSDVIIESDRYVITCFED